MRGVRSESASYACYLPECSRAGQGHFCVHDCFSVPFIRLSVSRHASGLLRCVSSALCRITLFFRGILRSFVCLVASFAAEVEPSNGAQSEVLIGDWCGSSCGSAVSRPVLASMPIMCTLHRPLSTGGHVQMASACLFPFLHQNSMHLALSGSASAIGRAGWGDGWR